MFVKYQKHSTAFSHQLSFKLDCTNNDDVPSPGEQLVQQCGLFVICEEKTCHGFQCRPSHALVNSIIIMVQIILGSASGDKKRRELLIVYCTSFFCMDNLLCIHCGNLIYAGIISSMFFLREEFCPLGFPNYFCKALL